MQGTDGFPHKPAPDVVLASLHALGARPGGVPAGRRFAPDMEAGRRAGVKICAVRYGYGDPSELGAVEPGLLGFRSAGTAGLKDSFPLANARGSETDRYRAATVREWLSPDFFMASSLDRRRPVHHSTRYTAAIAE